MSLINVSDVVSSFNNQIITLKKFGESTVVRGRPQQEELPLEEITADVQNATGRALQVLPEGLRTRSVISVFSLTQMKGVSESNQTIADQVNYLGSWYRIYHVFPWNQNGYNEAVAVEINDNAN